MHLLYLAITLFLLTTLMGMYLSSCVFLEKDRPNFVIILHGILSITGFTILITHYPETILSISLFFLATGFGLCLLYQDFNGIPFTKWFCVAHAALSIAGCALLIRFAIDLN